VLTIYRDTGTVGEGKSVAQRNPSEYALVFTGRVFSIAM
jgi:hypothetical protein